MTPAESVRSMRPDQRNDRILPCLTGARGVGCLLVVLFHFGWLAPLPGTLYKFGGQTVSFFFILSGVVLTYSYCDAIKARTIGWSKFFNLRLTRIVPVHVATWLIATVLHLCFAWNYSVEIHPAASWLSGLLCLQVYWPSLGLLYKWNAPAWSISCELFFYALFPFLLLPLVRRLTSTGSLIAAICCIYLLDVALFLGASETVAKLLSSGHSFLGYQTYYEATRGILHVFPLLRVGEFLIGMCIGLLILRCGCLVKSPLKANLLLGFSAAAIWGLTRLPGLTSPIAGIQAYPLFVPFLALMLVALASGLTVLTPLLDSGFCVFLGEISYSLYLVHCFFFPGNHPTKITYILCLLGSIVSAILLYRFLERPARSIWRKFLSNHSLSAAKPIGHPAVGRNAVTCDNRVEFQN